MNLKNFKKIKNVTGEIFVYESQKDIPFKVKRTFIVKSEKNGIRGNHSHKKCYQMLVCVNGIIKVTCISKRKKSVYTLSTPKVGLLIPPGIWSIQEYLKDNSILLVFCDRVYEEKDYIRDFEEFMKSLPITL